MLNSKSPLPETYQQCLDFFYARNQFSIKLGLETTQQLLQGLGNPEAGQVFFHVAGTNGKGSVCANLVALLQATGFEAFEGKIKSKSKNQKIKIGLYTSPHLVSFRERIRVNGEPIPADFILQWLRGAQALILKLNATYFESITALALDYFRACECDLVVLETGLGGRLDATNAVQPVMTIITSMSLDHTSILGNTIEEIWQEKIGIMKEGVPMVVQENRPHLLAALKEKAEKMHCPVYILGDAESRYRDYNFPKDLRPEVHQKENLCLALLAMETFLKSPLPDVKILEPFLRQAQARLPGRTQLLQAPGRISILLDGAHNPGGMEVLKNYLDQGFQGKKIHAVFSIMRDKNYKEVLDQVLSFADKIYFYPLEEKFPRALSYSDLIAGLTSKAKDRIQELSPSSFNEKLSSDNFSSDLSSKPADLIVICGSLYLLGEVIPRLLPFYPDLEPFRDLVETG